MSTQTNDVQTSVQTLDLDIDALFSAAPSAESIVLPDADNKKPSIFSKNTPDLSFLDPGAKDDDDEKSNNPSNGDNKDKNVDLVSRETSTDSLEDILKETDPDSGDDTVKSGRPKLDKSGLVDTMSKLIEEGLLIPFEDEKPMDEYSVKDWKELIEANFQEREKQIRQETPKEFFESLPEELQYAAKYVADGGQDLKSLFRVLSQVEEVREMNPEVPGDQETIIRSYLRATGFGDEGEIDEEISTWKDLGKLEAQARKFKPKLDAMQEQVVQEQLQRQEAMRMQQQEAAEAYVDNVYEALKTAEINGLKLDKKTQAQLYSGLVQPQYPSINGRNTNLLGHLLEKYQFVEPNYSLIAEALWLLSNPDEYRQSLVKQGKNQAVEQSVRLLKTEQSRKIASSVPDEQEQQNTQRKIPRGGNIFKR
jgi:hypothetical protein